MAPPRDPKHLYYRRLGSYPIGDFAHEDPALVDILANYGWWMQALKGGVVPLRTSDQQAFVDGSIASPLVRLFQKAWQAWDASRCGRLPLLPPDLSKEPCYLALMADVVARPADTAARGRVADYLLDHHSGCERSMRRAEEIAAHAHAWARILDRCPLEDDCAEVPPTAVWTRTPSAMLLCQDDAEDEVLQRVGRSQWACVFGGFLMAVGIDRTLSGEERQRLRERVAQDHAILPFDFLDTPYDPGEDPAEARLPDDDWSGVDDGQDAEAERERQELMVPGYHPEPGVEWEEGDEPDYDDHDEE